MNNVKGIYTQQDYQRLTNHLRWYYPWVHLFWVIGVETGYRVSDLLRLRYSDIDDDGGICILEQKTKKIRHSKVSENTLKHLEAERVGNKSSRDALIWPYNRQQIWRWLKIAGQGVDLPCISLAHIAHARHTPGIYFY